MPADIIQVGAVACTTPRRPTRTFDAKVINHYGDEVLKVYATEGSAGVYN